MEKRKGKEKEGNVEEKRRNKRRTQEGMKEKKKNIKK